MLRMKKEVVSIIFIFAMLILTSFSVSATCCEKLKDSDMWCVAAGSTSECDAGYRNWHKETCNSVGDCSGTCVDLNTGECSEYTPKSQCIESGGSWSQNPIDQVPACQEGCCTIGLDTYFVNDKKCKNLMEEFNIQGNFDPLITSRGQCEMLTVTMETGACVISTPTERACKITSNNDCTSEKIGELSELLNLPSIENQIEVRFYEGLLCTASMNGVGISDCVKSQNTECYNNKVYYIDSCGNLANIYDSSKYNDASYWIHLKKEYDSDVCNVGASGSSTCGNCDTTLNTVCRNYQDSAGASKPQNNVDGLICGDLSCQYKGRTYQHGESWCYESPGTMTINKNLTTGQLISSNLTALKNATKYNLPGSRYYKMICSAGEVIVEECADYRNEVCIQGVDDYSKRIQASCVFNPWRSCSGMETKTDCENPSSLCKWIPGYRWDLQVVAEKNRKEMQGSCVPLIAPGFDFWNGLSSQGSTICAMANVQEDALFETPVLADRDSINEWTQKSLSQRCIDGCYALPEYGEEFNQRPGEEKQYPEEIGCSGVGGQCTMYDVLTEFYDESEFRLPTSVVNYHLSTRRGQYCNKDGKPDNWLTGGFSDRSYDCTPGAGGEEKDERKERDYPIYLTNDEWIRAITERAKSMGDCGYKMSVNKQYSAPESEIITAIFQKMKQDTETVRKNVTVEQIIYKGNSYLNKANLEDYETELPVSTTSTSGGSTCASAGGVCTTTVNNPEPCTNGEANTEATCPANMVCCMYTYLE